MTEHGRREYAAVMWARYHRAGKRERGRLLDEYCRTTGCHRKAAIRRLRAAPGPPGRPTGRPCRYVSRELAPILERAWLASDQLSGKLLRPILPALLRALARHQGLGLTPAVQAALTAASAATLDRLLRPLRRRRPRQPRRLAPALASLRAQVPVRTWSEWTEVRPGALQGDLVLHCGESTAGRYCATLVAVDVATSWTELQALYDLHQQRVTGGLQHIQTRLPLPLREWHSDNVLSARGWSSAGTEHSSGGSWSRDSVRQRRTQPPQRSSASEKDPAAHSEHRVRATRGGLSPHLIQRRVPAEGPSIIYGVARAPTARLRGIDPLGRACSW